jgi:4-diphosphocytidyl-2C-methyl-D-erythritol kinase
VTLRLKAPAKLNTFLHIVGRRSDGYHELQSAFVLINWCDEISLDLRSDGVVSREVLSNEAGVAFDGDDLCTRAAKALQTFCSREQLVCTSRFTSASLHKRAWGAAAPMPPLSCMA